MSTYIHPIPFQTQTDTTYLSRDNLFVNLYGLISKERWVTCSHFIDENTKGPPINSFVITLKKTTTLQYARIPLCGKGPANKVRPLQCIKFFNSHQTLQTICHPPSHKLTCPWNFQMFVKIYGNFLENGILTHCNF